MTEPPAYPQIRLRVLLAEGEMMGPGKAELLERIETTGSIAAAGREMGMSYKRAWQLVETLNAMFRQPLVQSTRGGPKGGGAVMTETGRAALAHYRGLEAATKAAGAAHLDRLCSLLVDIPERK